MKESLTYADAGVDIDKANELVDTIKEIAKQTHRPGVMSEIGGFGGLFSLNTANLERPVLVSSTDGVGTKLKIAFATGIHDTVGIDLVAMCVNDIIVQGAKPLFFLDYLAMGRLDNAIATDIIRGIGEGCRLAQCALIGGETAEMPGMYRENEYDLAGFVVGVVDNSKIPDGSEIRAGYKLIGIGSSGLHSNGFSLVRKICFEVLKLKVDELCAGAGQNPGRRTAHPDPYLHGNRAAADQRPSHPGAGPYHRRGIVENVLRIIPQVLRGGDPAGIVGCAAHFPLSCNRPAT